MSDRTTRRRYTTEFKTEAVQLVVLQCRSTREVAESLGINSNILGRWVREFERDPDYAFPGQGKLKEPEEELRQLRKQLADAQMERDILKKALAIFSKPSH
jgi:transposase